jgi:hypothetical protein
MLRGRDLGRGQVSREGLGSAFGLGSSALRSVPFLDDLDELRSLPLRLRTRCCRLGSHDLAADERRLGGAPVRQILGKGNRASRQVSRSQKEKGMPETAAWRILGTSLQKTSSDDRSNPTVASAHSRSSPQDWSSCSSSRTKTGSEASRVRNRSNGPGLGAPPRSDEAVTRPDGSRVHAHLF